jgi:hypothetical protein
MNKTTPKIKMNNQVPKQTKGPIKSKKSYIYRADDLAEIQDIIDNQLRNKYAIGKLSSTRAAALREAIKQLLDQ